MGTNAELPEDVLSDRRAFFKREGPRAGEEVVHFPRLGYQVELCQ